MTTPPPDRREPQPPLIRASELSQYGYCKRAWWLSTVKRLTADYAAARERGSRYHEQHARQVQAAQTWQSVGVGLLLLGGAILLLALVVGL